jgi:WD40 repeat protein
MSRVFLSHSSRDLAAAIALKQWLAEQEPPLANEIFLDTDPGTGLGPGVRWRAELFKANSRCEAVICLLSKHWEASHECKTEFRTAENLGKPIFCARLEETTGKGVTDEWQHCDLFCDGAKTIIEIDGDSVAFATAGLHRLLDAIRGAGIGAERFVWPPPNELDRAPYRGWEPFEERDAAVFYGRDAALVHGLDVLRAMRRRVSGLKSIFVVLGPSGAGKSSFLRAGLLPRLRREDDRFLPLGIVRPHRDVLTGESGLAASIQTARQAVNLSEPPLGDIKVACVQSPQRVCELLREVQHAAAERLGARAEDGPPPTLVLPLDQAEELFTADATDQSDDFLTLIAALVSDLDLVVVATIRTDRYEVLQTHPALADVSTVVFDDLKPMPATQFIEVITGPAARATDAGRPLRVAPDLVQQLLDDAAEGADTLPLLSLTLARLYADYGSSGVLTLGHYEQMGGMRHVVHTEIASILSRDATERQRQLQLLRAAFIPWLATINPDNDQPLRRVARYAELPEPSRPLIDALIGKRLMVKDTRDGDNVVEVALESLLRQWDDLAGWLADERQNLKRADELERSAAAWRNSHRSADWLMTGTRLADAEALAGRPEFLARLAPTHEYLAASRIAENQHLYAEQQHREAEIRNAQERADHAQESQRTAELHAAVLRRRSHILRGVLAATAVVAVMALVLFGWAVNSRHQAQQRAREATAERVAAEALAMLNRDRPGGDARAIQEMLAATSISPDTTSDDAVAAALKLSWASKVISPPGLTGTAAYSPDGSEVVSGGFDHNVRVWNADTGEQIGQPLTGHTGRITSVAFSPNGQQVASVSDDGELRVWDIRNGRQVGEPIALSDASGARVVLWSVAYSPDGRHIATGGEDNNVRLWDAQSMQPSRPPMTGHTDVVYSVAFSPDGRTLASGSRDNNIRLWNGVTGEPIGAPLTGHSDTVLSVAFSPDGHRLASGSHDATIWIWDGVDTGRPVGKQLVNTTATQTRVGHTAGVSTVAFSTTGNTLISGSIDGTIRWWVVESGFSMQLPATRRGDNVKAVAFRPGQFGVMSCSSAGGIQLWNNLALAVPLEGHDRSVTGVAFSPDGKHIASSSSDETVRLWNPVTGASEVQVMNHQAGVGWLAYSHDGSRIVSSSWDGKIHVWDATTGVQERVIDTHTQSVGAVVFSPDGHRIVSADGDNNLQVWNADTGEPIGPPMTGHTEPAEILAFSPDGKLIASGSDDKTIRLWSVETGKQVGELTGHDDYVYSVAFSPDGHRLVSGSWDGTVRIWNLDSRTQIGQPLTGHAGQVYVVAFSPNGRYIASGGEDGTVRIWNANTAEAVGAPLSANSSTVKAVAFSPDGTTLVSAGSDDNLHLWPFPVDIRDTLCSKLAINMSHKQWAEWISPNVDYVKQCPDLPVSGDDSAQ